LILFAFIALRRHDAILDPIGMEHHRGEIEEKQAEPPPGRGERSKENKNTDRNCTDHPEKSCQDVSLINVPQTGNDAEQDRDHVAGFAFRGLCRAAHSIAAVATLCILRQKMSAIRTGHFIARARFGRSGWRIRVFYLHTCRNSSAGPNSSSKQNQNRPTADYADFTDESIRYL